MIAFKSLSFCAFLRSVSTTLAQDPPTFSAQPAKRDRGDIAATIDQFQFFRKDICGYLGVGINAGGDYPSDYKSSLIALRYSDVRTSIFLTVQGGFDFAVLKVEDKSCMLPLTQHRSFGGVELNVTCAWGIGMY